jgi:MFS family permease
VLDLLRRNRDVRLLFFAVIVNYCGDWFATVAVLGDIGDLTGDSALAAGGVFVAQSLPSLLLGPIAGPVADRFDRRRILLVVSLLQVVAALGFLGIGAGRVWVAYVVLAAIAALASFFGPASSASLPNLVDPDDLPTASTMFGATWGAMLAVGASLGAVFSAAFGRDAAYVADAVSFLIAAALVAGIRRPTRSAAPGATRVPMRPIADTREAVGIARRDPALLALLCSKAGFGLASGMVGLLAVLAEVRYDSGDLGIGLLLAARGVGVVVGPLLAKRYARPDVASILRICALSCLLYGTVYLGVAAAPLLALAAVGVLIAHLGGGVQWTLSTYGLQVVAPDHARGRIMAADFSLVSGSMTVSYLAAGGLEALVGPGGAMVALCAVALAWGVLYLRLTAALRGRAPAT